MLDIEKINQLSPTDLLSFFRIMVMIDKKFYDTQIYRDIMNSYTKKYMK